MTAFAADLSHTRTRIRPPPEVTRDPWNSIFSAAGPLRLVRLPVNTRFYKGFRHSLEPLLIRLVLPVRIYFGHNLVTACVSNSTARKTQFIAPVETASRSKCVLVSGG